MTLIFTHLVAEQQATQSEQEKKSYEFLHTA